MKTINTCYTLIGCLNNCKHREDDTKEESESISHITRERYKVVCITPHCAKSDAIATRRQSIYNRADNAQAKALNSGKQFRTAQKHWRQVADEYTTQDCPFFSA